MILSAQQRRERIAASVVALAISFLIYWGIQMANQFVTIDNQK